MMVGGSAGSCRLQKTRVMQGHMQVPTETIVQSDKIESRIKKNQDQSQNQAKL